MSRAQVRRKGPHRINPDKVTTLGRALHRACRKHNLTKVEYNQDSWDHVAQTVYDMTGNDPPLTEGQVSALIGRGVDRHGGTFHTKLQGDGGLCEAANWTYRRMRNMIGTWAGAGRLGFEILDGGRGVKFTHGTGRKR